MTERIESFRDLRVYKLAFELQQEIFEKTKSFSPARNFTRLQAKFAVLPDR